MRIHADPGPVTKGALVLGLGFSGAQRGSEVALCGRTSRVHFLSSILEIIFCECLSGKYGIFRNFIW